MKKTSIFALLLALLAGCQSPAATVSVDGEAYLVETAARTHLDSLWLDAESGVLTGSTTTAFPGFLADQKVEVTLPDGQVVEATTRALQTTRRNKRAIRGSFQIELQRD